MKTPKKILDELFELLDDMSLLSDEDFEKFCELEKEYIIYYKKRNEIKKMKIKHVHCPVNDWTCPHYVNYGHISRCTLENPLENCDDFAFFWDKDDDYIDDDWSDEE